MPPPPPTISDLLIYFTISFLEFHQKKGNQRELFYLQMALFGLHTISVITYKPWLVYHFPYGILKQLFYYLPVFAIIDKNF